MKKFIFCTLLCALVVAAQAQQQNVQFPQLPNDSAVRVGHLDNGLTYYIRHNEMPKQRCEFHIAQAVGAILEEDDQNGLAHFLEHMCFNGTQHFEGKGIRTEMMPLTMSPTHPWIRPFIVLATCLRIAKEL